MESTEIRRRFLAFFEKRGHAIIPSASLVPENDPSTLFTTAGMQPLVPYLLGEPHPKGRRLANVQKCLRTGDIDEVGDNTHLTFFEMLGNWSLGDPDAKDGIGAGYWKKEAIEWSYELLTSKEEGFGLDPNRLYVTVFEGNNDAPKDEESIEIWKKAGVPENRIYLRSADDNWWSPGESGPCGPDTEMFYDVTKAGLGDLSPEAFQKMDDEKKVVEIWNDVFMEYEKHDGQVIGKLKQKNVDTGAGLERVVAVLQRKDNVFETDLLEPIVEVVRKNTRVHDIRTERIIADHIRAAAFLAADGISVSNTGRGYVLRRLIRRAVRFAYQLGMRIDANTFRDVEDVILDIYKPTPYFKDPYIESEPEGRALGVIDEETEQFRKTLDRGLKAFEKGERDPFVLFTTYGFPLEVAEELARERGETLDIEKFEEKMREHQEKSRTAAAGMFRGGLADHSDQAVKLHTAHHLLLAALQKVLGKGVKQRGSNITPERLRIDFSFERKVTPEELIEIERVVNEAVERELSVVRREMPLKEAKKLGAEMEFGAKYPDTVSVYFIEDRAGNVISKEFCGGPHVLNTRELGRFTIQKEEAVSAGVRRIKATLW